MPCIFRDRAKGDLLVQQTRQQAREFERIQHSARRCADCGHVFFVPPAADVLSRYYQDVYPASSISWSNVDADYETSRVKYRSKLILKISARYGFGQSDRYHESGCAFGGTILELDRMGYSATGTDWNTDAVDQGRARGNASIFAKSDLEFFQHSTVRPNVVFGIYMLERMADPLGYLCELAPLLASRSIVIMLVPNAMALFPTAYGFDQYDWFSYPSKLNMYSPHSVSCLARAAGYDLLEVSTATSGLEPEATSAISGPRLETPSTIELREQMINGGLFGEELAFVITPQGSPFRVSTQRTYWRRQTGAKRRESVNSAFEGSAKQNQRSRPCGRKQLRNWLRRSKDTPTRNGAWTRSMRGSRSLGSCSLPVSRQTRHGETKPIRVSWRSRSNMSTTFSSVSVIMMWRVPSRNSVSSRVGGRVICLKPRKGSRFQDLS